MKTGIKILKQAEETVKSLQSYTNKIEELRAAEAKAEEEGNFEVAMTAFAARMEVILRGPVPLALLPDPYDIMSKLFGNVVYAIESGAGVELLESLFADATMQLEEGTMVPIPIDSTLKPDEYLYCFNCHIGQMHAWVKDKWQCLNCGMRREEVR